MAIDQQQGLIAILDALGAANYSQEKIGRFLKSRELVLEQLRYKATRVKGIDPNSLTTFTFNDTVLILYQTNTPVTLADVRGFGELLRRFAIKSLEHGILFRGSLSIGPFYVDSATNTVLGDAVTDAASWYNVADWIGVLATPQATLFIQSLIEQSSGDIERLLVDYDVPLKNQRAHQLKAVNWPKAFFVKGMTPCSENEKPRSKCLALLTEHGVPKGTESKYFNTLAFFDHCVELYNKSKKKRT